jgi:hypothetical protein
MPPRQGSALASTLSTLGQATIDCYTENSDFLTLHNVFASWRRVSANGSQVHKFCRQHFLSLQVSIIVVVFTLRVLTYETAEPSADRGVAPAVLRVYTHHIMRIVYLTISLPEGISSTRRSSRWTRHLLVIYPGKHLDSL